jgi:hypothetical protein
MLIVDVSVNRFPYIDSIQIQRISGKPGEICNYKIRKPEGFDDMTFAHHYDDGYFLLLVDVVKHLELSGYAPKIGDNND